MYKQLVAVGAIAACFYGLQCYRENVIEDATVAKEKILETEVSPFFVPEPVDFVIPPQDTLEKREVTEGYTTDTLIGIQQEAEKLRDETERLRKILFTANLELDTYERIIGEKENSLDEKKKAAENYMRLYYLARKETSMRLGYLAAGDYPDMLYRRSTVEEIMRRLGQSVERDQEDEAELERNKAEVSLRANLYEATLSELDAKTEELKAKEKEIADYMRTRKPDLLLEFQEASQRLGNYIARSKYSYEMARTGKFMILPVQGEVTSPWGTRTHPIQGDVRHHAGVDLGVDYGTPVRAAADGIVSIASWYGGYGKLVMIAHGSGITTLYGHNDKIIVGEGDIVKQGQVIALAGSTGNSTGPHCHFEVRKNGDDIDPYTYVVGQ